MENTTEPLVILVAGEASGDQLGAALIRELRILAPNAHFAGIGGELMGREGLDRWWHADALSVMGLAEVVSHLPRLLKLRKSLLERIIGARPVLFIGIDSPDFNLGVEARLRRRGIRTVHYVSPTVWAWRRGRVKHIRQAADRVLCLFPFERDFLTRHGIDARYTGHPMADEIPISSDVRAAREGLGLDPRRTTLAILPGSRGGEVSRLGPHFAQAASLLSGKHPGLQCVAPMARPSLRQTFETLLARHPDLDLTLLDGQARTAIAASDVVLCASGTATLETMLVKRPMVVAYRFSHLTYVIGKSLRLMKSPFFALPNILAGEALVPELEQYQVRADRLAAEVSAWLDQPDRSRELLDRFTDLHRSLQRDATREAARAVIDLLPA